MITKPIFATVFIISGFNRMFKPKATLAEANKAGVGLNIVVSGNNAARAKNIATITESYGLKNGEMEALLYNVSSPFAHQKRGSDQQLILIRLLISGRIVFREKSDLLPFLFSVVGKKYRPTFSSLIDQESFNRET